MSNVIEKRSFRIPPCTVDKDLIKKVGEFVQKEFDSYYKDCFEETKEEMKGEEYYKKYPHELTELNIKRRMDNIRLNFMLTSDARNIESLNIQSFLEAEWPDKADEISVKLKNYSNDTKSIDLNFYIDEWRTSQVTVSGIDGTWVNGIADQLEKTFEDKKLSYHFLITHPSVRFGISFIAWASVSYAVLMPLWPLLVPHIKEGTQFIWLYLPILFGGSVVAMWPFESLWTLLFPRFEYGRSPSKRARSWIWGILVGSGFISGLILKLLGL